jgi:hypothetical protein
MSKRKTLLLLPLALWLIAAYFAAPGIAQFPAPLNVRESDGSPSVNGVRQIRVTNGSLTNVGGGIVSISTGGGGGGSLTVAEVDGAPSIAAVDTLNFDQGDGFVLTNTAGSIARVDLAAVPYARLNLTGAVLNADLAGSIAYAKLSLTGAILNADLAGSITAAKLVGSDIATVGTITSGTWSGTAIALAKGGTGAALVDPNADRILFWDDSAGAFTFLTPGTGLTITGTTIDASGGGGSSLPVVDTTSIVEGSADGTKEVRIEADGITTGTVRVWTAPDANVVVAGSAAPLTSGRIAFVTTGGLLTDAANLTYSGSDMNMSGGSLSITNAGILVNGSFRHYGNGSKFEFTSDGVALITNNAGNGFTEIQLGTTSVVYRRGTGSPEGAVTAGVGSLYVRTDGGANTTLYVKESGAGNTGWIAK